MSKSKVIQSKNIVISTQCFHKIGGIENIIRNLASEFTRKKYKITIFADLSRGTIGSASEYYGNSKIYNYGGIKFLRKLRKSFAIKKFLKSNNVLNIFFDTWKSAEPFFKLNSNSNIQTICLAHGNDVLDQGSSIKKRRICDTLEKIDKIIANSNFTKERIKHLGVDTSKIVVIHPGVQSVYHLDDFDWGDTGFVEKGEFDNRKIQQDMFLNDNDIDRKKPTLITIGRLEKRKGHINVINSLNQISKEYPNIQYIIIGDGPECSSIETRISIAKNKNIKLINTTKYATSVPAKNFALSISNIFIMPTIKDKKSFSIEGFGIVYIEAALLGIPSISSGIGGTDESVIHNKTGLICDGNNINSIKNSIKQLLENKKKYETLSKNAKKFASSFLWDKKINSYIKLLKN